MAYKGTFKPKNPNKYKGNSSNICYRSLWELKCMQKFDKTDSILEWSSEEVAIPYRCPVKRRWRRYFPDFVIKVKNKADEINTYMIEVKPHKETKTPVKPSDGRKRRRYLNEARKFANNCAKWEAAQEYCTKMDWTFQIWTEKTMNF